MGKNVGRRRREFTRSRADDHEELGSVGRGHDADNMEIAKDVIAAVAEGELERVGHLATELKILAGMPRGGKRIAAGVVERRSAGMLSGHGFLWGSSGMSGRNRKRNQIQGRGTEVPRPPKNGVGNDDGHSQGQ